MRPPLPTAQAQRPSGETPRLCQPEGPGIGDQVRPSSSEKSEPEGPTVKANGGLLLGMKAAHSRKPEGGRDWTGVQVTPPSEEIAALPLAADSAR